MKVLLIYAHPNKQSFTAQVLQEIKMLIVEDSHQIEVSDLYAQNFNSDLSLEEHIRESCSELSIGLAKDVQKEQAKLKNAECVIFLYPVWWSDCPAKLKGWFDRVWTNGFAYSKTAQPPELDKIKHGIVVCTAGHSEAELDETGVSESMRTIMLDDRLGDRFEHKEMLILAGTLVEEDKPDILARAKDIIPLISS